MNIPERLLAFLLREKKFFIATHTNPDGDALGSSIALSIALESLGKETTLYDKDPVPSLYKFLPGQERFTRSISNLKSFASGRLRRLAEESEPASGGQISNLILLDCNNLERIGREDIEVGSSAVIDHHETEMEFGDIKWVEPHAPATGLMVFYLIKKLGVKLTGEIATNLYTAIAIDTGVFRYGNTTSEVLRVAAELIDAGANPSFIAENLYETWSENRFKLLLRVLNTLEISGNVSIVTVTQEMFVETGTGVEDTEHFSSFPRMLESVKTSVLFREIESNYYKVSLRSKGKINVAKIAEKFGGGGHRNAAGYKIRSDIKTAKETLLKALRNL